MRRFRPIIVLVLVCALASAPLWLGPGVINTRAAGDSPFLFIRTFELAANLRAGVFPARWMPDAAFGLGYPFFNFYAALPYYLAAGLNLLGIDLLMAIKLTQTLGMFGAAATMFLFARTMLPKWGATLAAAAYVLTPFHLVNVYVRGDSLSEFWAFVWYPLILWAVNRITLSDGKQRSFIFDLSSFIFLALALAALVLTHNVSALLFAPFIMIYALALVILRARRTAPQDFVSSFLRGLVPLVLAALLALALSAWFWLPALGEAPSAQLGEQTTGYFSYANHFRGANLIRPALPFDYTVDASLDVFAMGLAQVILIVAGAAIWFIGNRRAGESSFWLALMAGLFLLSTFMLTPWSAFVWERAPLLSLAQFPWRFLSVQAVFGAVLVGGVGKVEKLAMRNWRFSKFSIFNFQFSILVLILLWSALARLPNERLDIRAEDVTPYTVQLYEWVSGNIGTTIRSEYLPGSVKPRPLTGPDLLNMPRQAMIAQGGVAPDAVSSELLSRSPARQTWQVTARQPMRITLPVLYSPAWQARLDDAPAEATAYSGSGWLALEVPKGTHQITLQWEGTPLERTGLSLSVAGLLALVVFSIATIVHASPRRKRALGWGTIASVAGLMALALSARILQPSAISFQADEPPLQTLDYARRPFPHRAPVLFRSGADEGEGKTVQLIGASVEPKVVRAGQTFTLTLRWRDDRPPVQITVTQELPMGGEFVKLFRYARQQTTGDPRIGTQVVLSNTLPGPLLLKLSAADGAGRTLAPFTDDGVALQTDIAGKPAPAITLLGPSVLTTPRNAPARRIVEFGNGIALHDMDWFFSSAQEACFRPVWSRIRPNANRADALQVSLRLFGREGRLVAQADGQPQAGLAPTWSWPDGVLINDSQCVPTNGLLDANEPYTLQIVWYRAANLEQTGEATLRGVRGPQLNDLNVPGL